MGGAAATEAVWTTADYALIVSLCSAAVALASLGWNIWSKFIHPKPNVRVSIQVTKTDSRHSGDPAFLITGVNEGPGEIILVGVAIVIKYPRTFSKSRRWHLFQERLTRTSGGHIIHDDAEWPRRLKEGEYVSTVLRTSSIDDAMNYRLRPLGLGFLDTFERFHVLPEKGFQKLLRSIGVHDGQ